MKGAELEDFIRNAASTCWHYTCTAKVGRDDAMAIDSGNRWKKASQSTVRGGACRQEDLMQNTIAMGRIKNIALVGLSL
jgi:choline dehydrogenase